MRSGLLLQKYKTTIAEAGTLQLEFGRLSAVTGDPKYAIAAAKAQTFFYQRFKEGRASRFVMRVFYGERSHVLGGLFPVNVGLERGDLSGHFSWGAGGDSFYEYLLKCWLAQGRDPDSPLLEMYSAAVEGLMTHMVHTSSPGGLKYISSSDNRMEHLACFVPGLLALGAHVRPQARDRQAEFSLAEELAYTCHEMYKRMATGMAAEAVIFGQGSANDFVADAPSSMWTMLRPETVESFFILHELTGDPKYREWGHEVFDALEKTCRAPFGYGVHPDVTKPKLKCCMGADDKEPTFFAAETLKYLFLLQDPERKMSLETFVFSTEGHPLPL
eukprot:gnl/TRDRNA2_/TRDRNA2_145764_c0_seq2.p1 gnl/TRDRNA2_/TRDRNA2_145764_c0~~gnl/TRDRNA2_/TRDRNA2_145764_c0_seq2.p1  ORF type:complete len:383 (+),score=64.50 gnl/TRDRNA2_/TRDRNA2_145764_c0_seq2:162-1151(+)